MSDGELTRQPVEQATAAIGKRVTVVDYPDGRLSIRYRLTLYERSDTTGETAFRYSEENGVGLFYWSDQDFGYALAAKADRQKLLQLAEIVYHQLSGDSPKTKFPPPPVPPGKAS